jgi:hypothetical protein
VLEVVRRIYESDIRVAARGKSSGASDSRSRSGVMAVLASNQQPEIVR